MTGRDNPKVYTESRIRQLLSVSETLGSAGYDEGDYLPVVYTSGSNTGRSSTDSGSYQPALNNGQGIISWDLISPSNGTLAVWFYGDITSLNGTTIDVRVRNLDDGQTMCERTGISELGTFQIQPTDYAPTTDMEVIRYRTQIRSGDGVSNVEINTGSIVIGVEI